MTPWNFGARRNFPTCSDRKRRILPAEIGLCSDVEAAVRLAAYGDVAYMNERLMEYTVRGDSDRSRRASRNRAVAIRSHPWASHSCRDARPPGTSRRFS